MKTTMLRLSLLLGLALLGCKEESAGRAPASAPPTAVTSAVVKEQALDSDGDGKVDTWLTDRPDGSQLEKKDTNGDGKPDEQRVLEPLKELPPGFEAPAGLEPVGK